MQGFASGSKEVQDNEISYFNNKKIATSYPATLQKFKEKQIEEKPHHLWFGRNCTQYRFSRRYLR